MDTYPIHIEPDVTREDFPQPCRICGGTGATPSSLYNPPGPCPCTWDEDDGAEPDEGDDPNPDCSTCGDKGVIDVDGIPEHCDCSDLSERGRLRLVPDLAPSTPQRFDRYGLKMDDEDLYWSLFSTAPDAA